MRFTAQKAIAMNLKIHTVDTDRDECSDNMGVESGLEGRDETGVGGGLTRCGCCLQDR